MRSAAVVEQGGDEKIHHGFCRARNPIERAGGAGVAVFDNDGALWIRQPMYVQTASPLTAKTDN